MEVRMGLPEEVEVPAEVTGVRQRGRELGWGSVFQVRVEEDFHSVRDEDRQTLETLSSD